MADDPQSDPSTPDTTPTSDWPYTPTTLSAVLPGDLPFFLQAGATYSLDRAVSLIDPLEKKRFDAPDRWRRNQPFCRFLRSQCNAKIQVDGCCSKCDVLVAETFIRDFHPGHDDTFRVTRYRCYLGLEELAAIISVGGHPVMMVSGQFLPPEGKNEVLKLIECLGNNAPNLAQSSSAFREAVHRFHYTPDLWTTPKLTSDDLNHLHGLADSLTTLPAGFQARFLAEVKRVQQIAQHYFEMGKSRVEARITSKLHDSLMLADTKNTSSLWTVVDSTLAELNAAFSLTYSAFFCGSSETDTLLTLRAKSGQMPQDKKPYPHFNWRKAGLQTTIITDPQRQVIHHAGVDLSHTPQLQRGFRGSADNPFQDARAIVPVMLPQGPLGVLILGPHNTILDSDSHTAFLFSASLSLATSILPLHLSNILNENRGDWRKTAKITGHRVRASIQTINSQISTIQAVASGTPPFTHADLLAAKTDLAQAFTDLKEVSFAAESEIHGALDVHTTRRSFISLGQILQAAIDSQIDLAETHHIAIQSLNLDLLDKVWVNETLMRFAFVNLINNGLKYSHLGPDTLRKVLAVQMSEAYCNQLFTAVGITNYGLGIKQDDERRVFEWGVRLAEATPGFDEQYGKGIGLWEVKHVVEGHGGKIHVSSRHRSGGAITNANIHQCYTTFTVQLPISHQLTSH